MHNNLQVWSKKSRHYSTSTQPVNKSSYFSQHVGAACELISKNHLWVSFYGLHLFLTDKICSDPTHTHWNPNINWSKAPKRHWKLTLLTRNWIKNETCLRACAPQVEQTAFPWSHGRRWLEKCWLLLIYDSRSSSHNKLSSRKRQLDRRSRATSTRERMKAWICSAASRTTIIPVEEQIIRSTSSGGHLLV